MSRHNKTCRVCVYRTVKKADDQHKAKYSRCPMIKEEVKRDRPKCKAYFKERRPTP